jgi:hypothetical protein
METISNTATDEEIWETLRSVMRHQDINTIYIGPVKITFYYGYANYLYWDKAGLSENNTYQSDTIVVHGVCRKRRKPIIIIRR